MTRQNLDPQIRSRILSALQQHPGSSVPEIANYANCSEGAARRHLYRMVATQEVQLVQQKKDCDRFYPINQEENHVSR